MKMNVHDLVGKDACKSPGIVTISFVNLDEEVIPWAKIDMASAFDV